MRFFAVLLTSFLASSLSLSARAGLDNDELMKLRAEYDKVVVGGSGHIHMHQESVLRTLSDFSSKGEIPRRDKMWDFDKIQRVGAAATAARGPCTERFLKNADPIAGRSKGHHLYDPNVTCRLLVDYHDKVGPAFVEAYELREAQRTHEAFVQQIKAIAETGQTNEKSLAPLLSLDRSADRISSEVKTTFDYFKQPMPKSLADAFDTIAALGSEVNAAIAKAQKVDRWKPMKKKDRHPDVKAGLDRDLKAERPELTVVGYFVDDKQGNIERDRKGRPVARGHSGYVLVRTSKKAKSCRIYPFQATAEYDGKKYQRPRIRGGLGGAVTNDPLIAFVVSKC